MNKDMAATMFLTTGKSSLMHRMQNSPAPQVKGSTPVKGKKASLGATMNSTMMNSTMAETKGMMNTLEATRSSPFRDTIQRGMLTGVGLLNKPKFSMH